MNTLAVAREAARAPDAPGVLAATPRWALSPAPVLSSLAAMQDYESSIDDLAGVYREIGPPGLTARQRVVLAYLAWAVNRASPGKITRDVNGASGNRLGGTVATLGVLYALTNLGAVTQTEPGVYAATGSGMALAAALMGTEATFDDVARYTWEQA